jgi:hypothetical protein
MTGRNSDKILLFALLAIAAINLNCGDVRLADRTSNSANISNRVNTISVPVNSVSNPGKVDGVVETFTATEEDLENSFLNQPVPYIFLNFTLKDGAVEKVELPDEARKFANDYWKAALVYRLNMDINHPPSDGQTYMDTEGNYLRAAERAVQGFQKIKIKTPTGTRVISDEEAGGLIRFISQAAMTVTEQAKEQKVN